MYSSDATLIVYIIFIQADYDHYYMYILNVNFVMTNDNEEHACSLNFCVVIDMHSVVPYDI